MTATGGTRSAFSTHSLSLPARRPSGRVLGLCPLHGGGNRGSEKTASPGISATEAGVGPRTHARPGSCQALVRFMRSACGHMVTGSPPKCRAPARCHEAHGGHLAELSEIRPVSGSEDKQEKSRWGERESERTRGRRAWQHRLALGCGCAQTGRAGSWHEPVHSPLSSGHFELGL